MLWHVSVWAQATEDLQTGRTAGQGTKKPHEKHPNPHWGTAEEVLYSTRALTLYALDDHTLVRKLYVVQALAGRSGSSPVLLIPRPFF